MRSQSAMTDIHLSSRRATGATIALLLASAMLGCESLTAPGPERCLTPTRMEDSTWHCTALGPASGREAAVVAGQPRPGR